MLKNLHSTVVLLKETHIAGKKQTLTDLHSTVVLLKENGSLRKHSENFSFTFYCSSIKRSIGKQNLCDFFPIYILL